MEKNRTLVEINPEKSNIRDFVEQDVIHKVKDIIRYGLLTHEQIADTFNLTQDQIDQIIKLNTRRKVEFDNKELEILEKLAKLHFPDYKIAKFFGISRQTFMIMKNRDPRIQAILDNAPVETEAEILALQLQSARNGNTAMLKLLGEEWAGQGKDKKEEKAVPKVTIQLPE